MKNNDTKNPVESAVEAQSKTLNNFVETTQKFQKAVLGGQAMEKGSAVYNEWLEKQMDIFKSVAGVESGSDNGTNKSTEEHTANKPADFFQNWYNTQMESVKNMMETSKTFLSGMGAGNTQNNFMNNANAMNAWSNIQNAWSNTLNQTFNALNSNMNNGFSKDTFNQMFNSTNVYLKLQEIWQPYFKALQNNTLNAETMKNMFDANQMKNLTEQMFKGFFNDNVTKDLFENYSKGLHAFFMNNKDLSSEYFENLKKSTSQFTKLMSGDLEKSNELFNNFTDVYFKTFSPLLKVIAPGKEKENAEMMINALDKLALYNVRQSQLQYLLYTAGHTSFERSIEHLMSKVKNGTEVNSFQQFFQEWITINENAYTELFSSEEFSKLKSEVMTLSLGLRKNFENQFENNFSAMPVVFKSEMDEIYKTIYDLRKTVKNLEAKIEDLTKEVDHESESEKTSKSSKKK